MFLAGDIQKDARKGKAQQKSHVAGLRRGRNCWAPPPQKKSSCYGLVLVCGQGLCRVSVVSKSSLAMDVMQNGIKLLVESLLCSSLC